MFAANVDTVVSAVGFLHGLCALIITQYAS